VLAPAGFDLFFLFASWKEGRKKGREEEDGAALPLPRVIIKPVLAKRKEKRGKEGGKDFRSAALATAFRQRKKGKEKKKGSFDGLFGHLKKRKRRSQLPLLKKPITATCWRRRERTGGKPL